ncbi:MAG: hypothetical protein A3D28_06430 [Omnitrophica bacterium RIFCSPHIGHO2_02_FULL_63_14]|nr:MAG: hypothetical protein A3D28_06430 [Omnitrophica bacterium RIFCSPHIGHO2_02_FULL_63_14]
MILGVGKMGASVARALVGEVGEIAVFDRNHRKQERVARELSAVSGQTIIGGLEHESQVALALAKYDVCVCTTSNLRRIFTPNELPENTIVLDDSRPEAVPRVYDKQRGILVLEGGLMKIPGVELQYDFGFGNHEEVFGCLAEVYMLARDEGKVLAPTVGDVDPDNFRAMLSSQERLGIAAGGFWSGSIPVDPADIVAIIRRKHQKGPAMQEPALEKL